jgi:hypothetical protein
LPDFYKRFQQAAKIRMTFKFLKFHKHLVYNQSYIINCFGKKKNPGPTNGVIGSLQGGDKTWDNHLSKMWKKFISLKWSQRHPKDNGSLVWLTKCETWDFAKNLKKWLLSSNPNGVPDETPADPLFTTSLTLVLGIPKGFVRSGQVWSGLLIVFQKGEKRVKNIWPFSIEKRQKRKRFDYFYPHCRQFALRTIRMILV